MANRTTKVTISAQIQGYIDSMEKVAQTTREAGAAGEKLAQQKQAFQTLGTGMTVVGGAMTALTLAVAKTGIEYNTLQQTSRAALSTLLGGAEAAAAQMDKLDDFARTSPFAKTTFITAQQQMLAFGIEAEKVVPYLDAIQDAVAAAGGGNQQIEEIAFIMAQISSASKITGQDLLQFGQRGINAAELIGSQMGKTGAQIKAEITAGTLGADDALEALAEGMKSKFDGAAENVKDTFAGAMDRVQAAWRDLSSDLMKPLVDPSGGGALVEFLNWTADLMRAVQELPEPIKLAGGSLFALAGFVTLVSGAVLLATPRIAAMRVAFMALNGTMRGIAVAGGIAVLALTAIAAVVGAVAASQAEAAAKADAYMGTLEEGTNRVTQSTRNMAKEALAAKNGFLWMEQDSAYDAAEKLGISLDLVTDAAMGNADAMKELQKQIDAGADGSLAYANSAVDIENAVRGESESLEKAIEIAEQKQRADKESATTSKTAAEAYRDEADAAAGLVDELTGLVDTINEANGVARDAVTTNANYQAAMEGLTDLVEKNGTSLDENTASGSANASAMADLADKADLAAQAQFAQDLATMDADDAAKKYLDTLASQRQAFIDSATEAGFNATEVQKLADKVYGLPDEKAMEIIAETAAAQAEIDRLIRNATGRSITIKVFADGSGFRAGGKIVEPGMAAGGPVHGPGTKGVDSELRMLAPGEHVLTAGEVDAAGGHNAIQAFRSMLAGGSAGSWKPDSARRERSYGVWQAVDQRPGVSDNAAGKIVAAIRDMQAGPLVGSLTLQSSGDVKNDLEDVNFQLRAIGRGGRK